MQQTPSEQKPLRQSLPSEQAAPSPDFATQTPPTHAAVERHCASLVHEVGQLGLVPLQTKRPQLGFMPLVPAETLVQMPRVADRSQRSQPPAHALSQQTPSTQLPEMHWLPAVQLLPWASLATQSLLALQ